MFFTSLSFLAGTWLAASALFLYPDAPARAALATTAGLLVAGLSLAGIVRPRYRLAAGVVGAVLAASVFVVERGPGDAAIHLTGALLVAIGGLAPTPKHLPAASVEATYAPIEQPHRRAA
jgi:hypothetical protein